MVYKLKYDSTHGRFEKQVRSIHDFCYIYLCAGQTSDPRTRECPSNDHLLVDICVPHYGVIKNPGRTAKVKHPMTKIGHASGTQMLRGDLKLIL